MKKILAMLLCVALVAALGVSAFADAKTDLSDKVAGTLAGVGKYTMTTNEETLYNYINADASEFGYDEETPVGAAKAASDAAKALNDAKAKFADVKELGALQVAYANADAAAKAEDATAEDKAAAAAAKAKFEAAKAIYKTTYEEAYTDLATVTDEETGVISLADNALDTYQADVDAANEEAVITAAIYDTLNVAYKQAKAVADRARAVRQIVTNAKLDENSTVFDYAKVDAAVGQAIADYRLADAKSWLDGEKTYLGDAQKAVKAAIGDVVAIAQANAKVQKTNFEANVYNNVAAAYATASANMIAEAGANIAAALTEAAAYTAWIGAPDTAMNESIDSWFGVSFGE